MFRIRVHNPHLSIENLRSEFLSAYTCKTEDGIRVLNVKFPIVNEAHFQKDDSILLVAFGHVGIVDDYGYYIHRYQCIIKNGELWKNVTIADFSPFDKQKHRALLFGENFQHIVPPEEKETKLALLHRFFGISLIADIKPLILLLSDSPDAYLSVPDSDSE